MPIALYALALAAFAIGTTEFIVSGILPNVSADLSVSIPTAGLLVTGYAAGVAVIGPLLATFISRFPAKPTIIVLMVIFAIGQVLCALAANYGLLLGARLVSAGTHGVFFGVASVATAKLVPAEKRGAALALFISGITIANILGLPAGTAVGNAYSWRISFAAIAVLALVAAIAIALTLPRQGDDHEPEKPFAVQAAQLRHHEVWATFLMIVFVMVGALAFGTFQVPILLEITRIDPAVVPLYLLLGGVGATAGIFIGGRLADWRLSPSLVSIFFANAASLLVTFLVLGNPIAMGVMMVVNGAFGFMFSTPVQLRILKAAAAAPNLASTLISTAYNIGIALGAVVGAVLLTWGFGYTVLPLVGIACSTIAGLIALVSWTAERRTPVTA
jgi:DHA1 family inner membrane transport protein